MEQKKEFKLIRLNLFKSFLFGLLSFLVIGLFFGIISSLLFSIVATAIDFKSPLFVFIFLSVFILPLFLAILGGCLCFILGAIFNLILKIIKGFNIILEEVQVEEVSSSSPSIFPTPASPVK